MAKATMEINDEFIFSFPKESTGHRESREIPSISTLASKEIIKLYLSTLIFPIFTCFEINF